MSMKGLAYLVRFVCTMLPVFAFAQYYPQTDLQAPMDTPLYLSAPFGSLRENHFHSGMDIRTYEREGLPVYAVADGFVSRIKVSPVGYGKALYIDHPNGYTTVYGHLQKYEGEIAAYIKKYQYEISSFDFDHFPGRDRLPVKKGQIIGWSGNSGGSTGPHLHFEVRDTRSEEPLNPLLFGIPVPDTFDPLIKKVLVYNLDGNRPVILNDLTVDPAQLTRIDSDYVYTDTLDVAMGKIGFAVEAYDRLNNPTTEYSLYGMDMAVDTEQYFGYRLDRFSFDDSRCINMHIDYELYRQEGIRFQKCFLDDGNIINIYSFLRSKGKYTLKDQRVHQVKITVYDFNCHQYTLRFFIRGFPDGVLKVKGPACASAVLYPKKDNVFRTRDIVLEMPAKALYDTLEFCYQQKPKEKNAFSATHQVHDQFTPLQRSFTLSIRPDAGAEKYADKLLLAYYHKEGVIRAAGGEWKNGFVTARNNVFGNYFVTADTVLPVIRPVNIGRDGVVKDTVGIRFKIEDALSGIASYKLTLNGKWVLADYDAKNDLLLYAFDENMPRDTPFELVLTVSDKKNNTAVLRREVKVLP